MPPSLKQLKAFFGPKKNVVSPGLVKMRKLSSFDVKEASLRQTLKEGKGIAGLAMKGPKITASKMVEMTPEKQHLGKLFAEANKPMTRAERVAYARGDDVTKKLAEVKAKAAASHLDASGQRSKSRYQVQTRAGETWTHHGAYDDEAAARRTAAEAKRTGYNIRLVDHETGAVLDKGGSWASFPAGGKKKPTPQQIKALADQERNLRSAHAAAEKQLNAAHRQYRKTGWGYDKSAQKALDKADAAERKARDALSKFVARKR